MADILFSVFDDGLGPTFGSFFVKPAEMLNGAGWRARVVSFARIGEYLRPALSARWAQRKAEFSDALPGSILRWPLPPSRLAGGWRDSAAIAAFLLAGGWTRRDTVLHCGGAPGAYHAIKAVRALRAKSIRVVFHSYGPLADEYAYGVTGRPDGDLSAEQEARYLRQREIETFAYQNADAVITLSDAMTDHARHVAGDAGRPLVKIPCLVDWDFFSGGARRDEIRKSLDAEDKIIFAYCGSMHPWQRADRLFELFAQVSALRSDCRLLVLSNQPRQAHEMCAAAGVADELRIVRSLPYQEVPDWLAAVDIGLMGRGLFEPASPVNTFSSPHKIPEYLAAGLPVVLGADVGDFSALLSERGLGVVAGRDEPIASVAERIAQRLDALTGAEIRGACRTLAKQYFDLEQNLAAYIDVYERLGAAGAGSDRPGEGAPS